MKINHKQEELVQELFNQIIKKYPEITFKNLSLSPDDKDHIWINIIADMDEDREIELMRYSSEIESDIHYNYGYRISIMPENPNLVLA